MRPRRWLLGCVFSIVVSAGCAAVLARGRLTVRTRCVTTPLCWGGATLAGGRVTYAIARGRTARLTFVVARRVARALRGRPRVAPRVTPHGGRRRTTRVLLVRGAGRAT